ncbi:uncharacterized protein LOC143296309 isoform X2 [Babylonia areolata]|uniref:uncharacterized protein LOC143296309 isoform X2 n=1 Tax=Babylonia areolata TaxID=304850 RepID=UPI003FD15E28
MSAVTMDHTGVGVVCLWLSAAMCVVHGQYYVNVALSKTYHQSSRHGGQGPSSMAANGDTSGEYPANCIHTAVNDTNHPWWQVDLGRTYPVYNMDVWARSRLEYRLYSNISVDGQWCASITSFPTNTRKKEVTCPTIMYGQTVRVTRLTYTGNLTDGYTLNLCEVQIWDCQAGWYGEQCNISCPAGCEDAVCDRLTGNCSECEAGFYGASCHIPCQYLCLNNECVRQTGLCEACPGNYRGNTCSECKPGFYGASCNIPCQYQCLYNECTRDTGLCEACPENYQGNTCSAVTDTTTDNTPVIVGAVVSVIVLIILVVFIVVFIKRRQHSAKSRAQESDTCNTAQNSGELGQPERAGSSPLSFAPAIVTGGRSSSTDRGQTSAVSQRKEDGAEHYERVDMADAENGGHSDDLTSHMSEAENGVHSDDLTSHMSEAENGVHSDDLTATSHMAEADSANPYDTPAVQYHNTGDVHLYHSWGNPQAVQ